MSPNKSTKNDSKYNTKNTKKNKLKKNEPDTDSSDDELFDEDEESDYETVSETDSTYTPPAKSKSKSKSNKNTKSKRRIIESESEEDEDEDEEEEEEEDEDEDEDSDEDDDDNEERTKKIQKIISGLFPSKYMSNKVKNNKKESKGENKKSKSKHSKKSKRQVEEESDEDSHEDSDEDSDDDEDEDDEKVDIIFSFGGEGYENETEEYTGDGDDQDCDSDDEKMFMKESYELVEMPKPAETTKSKTVKKAKTETTKSKKNEDKDKPEEITDVESEYMDLVETKKQLSIQLQKKPKNKILLNAIEECNHSIKKLVKKARIKNAKNYHKLIHDDKTNTNEVDYFKKKLSNKEQLRIMKDLKEINSHINIDRPYRLALLESKIPAKLKAIALQKLNVLKHMDQGDNEYYKIKNWVDTFMRIPFGTYKNLSVKIDDGIENCHNFMMNSLETLDNCVYGLNDAKMQIMQMVGQWISNPGAMGTAIAIHGPPGTGKTSLVKEGISKILGREFAFIALGGAGDSSFLEGHSYTYEGSTWGKIVQILLDSKCMNPVIYFDELDKISDTPRGEEIIGILTHLTDTSQNSQFHDKYFSDVDFDLSKCLFIFSYNDESRVNPILKDRMYRITTKGYDAKDKITIAKDYILPKIREQVNFKEEDVIIPDETISYIASSSALTKGEAGVRNLKRCLEIIYTKLNLFRLMKPNDTIQSTVFATELDIKVSFPFTVTKKEVDIFIKHEDTISQSMLAMYC
jgi:ATP-dependent Lon protease